MKSKNTNIRRIVTSALFAALTCVVTMVVSIPLPGNNGYVNLGDCFVILSGYLLGPIWGTMAAAVGASLADLFLGYAIYAPATFLIKGCMAAVAYFIFRGANKALKKHIILSAIAACVVAQLIMVFGYFLYEWMFMGIAVATTNMLWNSVQGLGGMVASVFLLMLVTHNKYISVFFRIC